LVGPNDWHIRKLRSALTLLATAVASWPAAALCATQTADPVAARAATAAEHLNTLTEIGIIVSGIGTIALVATVFVTAMATRAAVAAARAAREAVNDARTFSSKEFRPYIVATGGTTRYLDEHDHDKVLGYGFDLRFANQGKTPAAECSAYLCLHYSDTELPDDFEFPNTDEPFTFGLLMHGDQKTLIGPTMPKDFLSRIYRKEIIAVLYGWFEYSEIGSKIRFRTEYAAQVHTNVSPELGLEGIFQMRSMARFNGMDASCLRQPQPYRPHERRIVPEPASHPEDPETVH